MVKHQLVLAVKVETCKIARNYMVTRGSVTYLW